MNWHNLSPTLWISPLCNDYKCINDYVTDFIVTPGHFIRALCICRDRNDSIVRLYFYNIISMLL